MSDTLRAAWEALALANPAWIGLGLAVFLASLVAAGARWRVVLRSLRAAIDLRHATLASVACMFVNNVTPTGRLGGEACRIMISRQGRDLSLARGALASLGDRLCDIPAAALLGLLALPTLGQVLGRHATVVLAGALLAVPLGWGALRWLRSTLHAWITSWQRELGDMHVPPRAVLAALGYSGAFWGADLLRLFSVGMAFGLPFTVPQLAALSFAQLAGGFVPTPGGIGAIEGALFGVLALLGVPLDTAVAFVALERLLTYGTSTVLGAVSVAFAGGRTLLRAALRRGAVDTGTPGPPAGAAP